MHSRSKRTFSLCYNKNMFEIINEVAVIGCALLMMAVATLWYSSDAFGKVFGYTALKHTSLKSLLLLGVSYSIAIALLSYGTITALRFGTLPLLFGVSVAVFVSALFMAMTFVEEKPLRSTFIHHGFLWVFIVGSVLIVHHWPW